MNIGLLNAYYFSEVEEYQKIYTEIFGNFFREIFPNDIIRLYNVALGDWPKDINQCDVWVISGSGKSCYEEDPWIRSLIRFVQTAHEAKKKLIGICFGHQLIAQALGGVTERHDGGWGLGAKEFEITKHQPWMKPKLNKVTLLFSHQDQVKILPPNATQVAQSEFCKNQMFTIGNHVLTMQGHPEYTPEFSNMRLNSRKLILNEKIFKDAQASMHNPTHADVFRQWIANFCRHEKD